MSMASLSLASQNIKQGDTALAKRDLTKAIQHYQIELKNNPDSVIARTKLAKCYMRKGYRVAATKMITEAVILNPNDVEALLLKSKQLVWNQQPKKAEEVLGQVIALSPDNVEALSQLADIYNDQGNTKAADKLYLKINTLRVSK